MPTVYFLLLGSKTCKQKVFGILFGLCSMRGMEDMNSVLSSLAKNVKALRYVLRLSQDDLAGRLGVAVQTISAIERGVRKPSLDTIVGLARALDVRVVDLFSEKLEGEAWFVNLTLVRDADGEWSDRLRDQARR